MSQNWLKNKAILKALPCSNCHFGFVARLPGLAVPSSALIVPVSTENNSR